MKTAMSTLYRSKLFTTESSKPRRLAKTEVAGDVALANSCIQKFRALSIFGFNGQKSRQQSPFNITSDAASYHYLNREAEVLSTSTLSPVPLFLRSNEITCSVNTTKMSVVGVDLGTLNTVIAVARNRGVDVVSISLRCDASVMTADHVLDHE